MSRIATSIFEPFGVRPLIEVLKDLERYDDEACIYVEAVLNLGASTMAIVDDDSREVERALSRDLQFVKWTSVEEAREATDFMTAGDFDEGVQRLIDLIQDYAG